VGRHRGDAEARLIRAARGLLPRTGVSGLKVRQVAARAGVPPGAFHYYFHSRHEFCQRVLSASYEGQLTEFDAAVGSDTAGSPVQRLRHMLRAMARFARQDRKIALALLRDILNGDPDAIAFIRSHMPRHTRKAVALVVECQRAGLIRRMPLPAVMSLLGAMVMSAPMEVAMIERLGVGHPLGPVARGVLLSDRQIDDRVDLVIHALAPHHARKEARA